MEKRTKQLIIRWLILTGLTGGLFTLFWTGWYLIAGEVPTITSVKMTKEWTYILPFGISRWWGILIGPIWSTIVILFLFAEEESKNDKNQNISNGLFLGLIIGLIPGLVSGLNLPLITGLTAGLIFGLFTGLLGGIVAFANNHFSLVNILKDYELGFGLSFGISFVLSFGLVFELIPFIGLIFLFLGMLNETKIGKWLLAK